ncbi:thiamine ABC transporter substrate-binding protein [Candidatus Thorarchaeota archaeon]|nr:MAG: thiamine ABC transporter substrate-binding protein [Candidatus Thorarchaeota archaeon]
MSESYYPERRDPRKIVAAIVAVVIIVIAAFAFFTWPRPKIRIYTYDSFMAYGENPDTIDETVFGPFEERYGVDIEITRLQTDANGIISRLVAESDNPVADVVMGIDNILILQSLAKQVLTPYEPENLSLVEQQLIDALDSEHYVVPFDYGLVTLIYKTNRVNETTHPEIASLTFGDLATPELASTLITENPHLSSPGLAFLLSQIAVYEKILEEDWTTWWSEMRPDLQDNVYQGWTEAWTAWNGNPSKYFLVSYGTDPAYSAWWTESEPDTAVAPFSYQDEQWAWMQVEGMGLVKNGPNPEIGKAFIEYCLSEAVQSYVATNQWMFPVNSDVTLDPVFEYAIHPDEVNTLNSLLTSEEIAANLADWLDDYDNVMS